MSPFFIYTQGRPHIILSSTSFYQKISSDKIVAKIYNFSVYYSTFILLFNPYLIFLVCAMKLGLYFPDHGQFPIIIARSCVVARSWAISNHHCPIMRRCPIMGNFQSSLPRVYTLGWGVSHLRCWEGMVFIPPRCIFLRPLFSSFSNLHTILWISNNLHADDNISS